MAHGKAYICERSLFIALLHVIKCSQNVRVNQKEAKGAFVVNSPDAILSYDQANHSTSDNSKHYFDLATEYDYYFIK